MNCFDDGGGAADKPSDGEEVSAGSGGEELAAFMDGEGDNGGNGGKGGKGPSVLYRVLGDDEDPAQGLSPKDPNAKQPIWSHVLNGSKSWYADQYISTSGSLAKALELAAKRVGDRSIVEIDTSQVIGDIIDISTPRAARAQGLKGYAYGLALRWREVLIQGSVPPEAINWVRPLSDFTLFGP
jgi:hypothetical protein